MPRTQHMPLPQVKLFELAFCLSPFSLFCLISDFSFTTSAVEAMSRFLSSLNRPSKFRTAQGSSPTPGRLPQTSTPPIVAYSPTIVVGVLPIVAGSPGPPAGQSQGASGEFAHVSSELLYSSPLMDKGKQPAGDSLQCKRKGVASS